MHFSSTALLLATLSFAACSLALLSLSACFFALLMLSAFTLIVFFSRALLSFFVSVVVGVVGIVVAPRSFSENMMVSIQSDAVIRKM